MAASVLVLVTAYLTAGSEGSSRLADEARDRAFAAFFNISTFDEVTAATDAITKSGVTFEDAYARLKEGRRYSKEVPTGVVQGQRREYGRVFYYSLDVPPDYDPNRRYPVRIHLHGGVDARVVGGRPGTGAIGQLAGDEPQIYILPTAWSRARWWSEDQVANLRIILALAKRSYNIDENRVTVSGVSDGGSGTFYIAMRDTTAYASFLPLIGSIMTLGNPDDRLDDLYPNNLLVKPFFIVNGGRDPLYPTGDVTPIVRYLRQGGVSVTYRPQPQADHDTTWWPAVKESFEQFEREHPRNPLPDALTWQCGDRDPFCRAHWLMIDQLKRTSEPEVRPDVNVVRMPALRRFGVRATGGRVTFISQGSNAQKLGLARFDVVDKINDLPVGDDMDEVLEKSCQPGKPIRLVVSRDGKTIELDGVYEPSTESSSTMTLLPRRQSRSGRVDLLKIGNTVRATTAGVAEYTLLISPEAFDFAQPLTVITNGQVSFTGRVEKSVATLLKWAPRDDDRTMLFGAEIHVHVN
jgi:poly(3-hydroxybutyrate) depolymerase